MTPRVSSSSFALAAALVLTGPAALGFVVPQAGQCRAPTTRLHAAGTYVVAVAV